VISRLTWCADERAVARPFALREEPSATPLIDIQGGERSSRERSDEAVFPISVVTALKVLRMKLQNMFIKRSIQNLEAAV
jgi:hypothetical protein